MQATQKKERNFMLEILVLLYHTIRLNTSIEHERDTDKYNK